MDPIAEFARDPIFHILFFLAGGIIGFCISSLIRIVDRGEGL